MGGRQPLSLGVDQCFERSVVMHELMHAAGFIHEHSRSDRDQYINVHLENADPANVDQFNKMAPWQNQLLSPFDYDSIMLYGSMTASGNAQPTMLTKDGQLIPEVWEKPGLSQGDVHGIWAAYGCRQGGK
ncbi:hypothetical protein HPB48_018120 [Haemaphysalis longicornis]|uniref:Metalloendopeptidase n=1 Tax=Haemaphysalis longicornis TaxID=44386 RepID=A0A9J6FNT3_HAELO|nr:hypothetical protein HPB48_018120 [Haemaphysalis longicornis]